MKSIIEEASSIAKAVEQGWIRAGKPQEFTIKVFEESEKNFLGFTTKPAKIAIFFQEQFAFKPHNQREHRPHQQNQQQQPQQPRKQQIRPLAHQQNQQQPLPSKSQAPQQAPSQAMSAERQPKKHASETPWNSDLIQAGQDWINMSLQSLNAQNVTFTTSVDRYALKVTFQGQITPNGDKEKLLFRSWAYLIMQALRQKYKRPLKGLKVILMSNA